MNNLTTKELEIEGCKTFVCPNLSIIDEKGKELLLRDETIKRAKDLAVRYFKETYHRPRYSSSKHVLPAFIYIASLIEGERRSQTEIAEVFNMSHSTVRKWYTDVMNTFGIKVISGISTVSSLIDSDENFVCPNLDIIDDIGNALGLRYGTIQRAKDLAAQYFKKTYLDPRYKSPQVVLPAIIYLASILEDDRIRQIDISMTLRISEASIGKWHRDIADALNLKIIYGGDGYVLAISRKQEDDSIA